MHKNETFDLSWDPRPRNWASTRFYVEQFLRDVADGSGTSHLAVRDHRPVHRRRRGALRKAPRTRRRLHRLRGHRRDSCQLAPRAGPGTGHDYPGNGAARDCPVSGWNEWLRGAERSVWHCANDRVPDRRSVQSELQIDDRPDRGCSAARRPATRRWCAADTAGVDGLPRLRRALCARPTPRRARSEPSSPNPSPPAALLLLPLAGERRWHRMSPTSCSPWSRPGALRTGMRRA